MTFFNKFFRRKKEESPSFSKEDLEKRINFLIEEKNKLIEKGLNIGHPQIRKLDEQILKLKYSLFFKDIKKQSK